MRELPRLRTTPEPGQIEPVNLANGLHTDGLKVNVVMRDAPGVASLCQVGPLVTRDSIAPRQPHLQSVPARAAVRCTWQCVGRNGLAVHTQEVFR